MHREYKMSIDEEDSYRLYNTTQRNVIYWEGLI
jgi:hypothetical protein